MSFISFFILFLFVFFISIIGIVLNRKNMITLLLCIELLLLSINFILIVASSYLDDIAAQNFSIFVLTIAAAESSIGLAIMVIYYRLRGTIAIEQINLLKG